MYVFVRKLDFGRCFCAGVGDGAGVGASGGNGTRTTVVAPNDLKEIREKERVLILTDYGLVENDKLLYNRPTNSSFPIM